MARLKLIPGRVGYDDYGIPTSVYPRASNPELLTIMNPARHVHPETPMRRPLWYANNPKTKRRKKASNPPLKKKVGHSMLTFNDLLKRNMKRALKGRKFKSGRSYFSLLQRVRRKTKSEFKKGVVYHRQLKLKIVGWGPGFGGKRGRR